MTDKEINKILGYGMNIKNNTDLQNIIVFSNQKHGFDIMKLEKDFYLTLTLNWISKTLPFIYFKGGTCLNKIYFPYFRLSEDLDFGLEYNGSESENLRRRNSHTVRDSLQEFCSITGFEMKPFKGDHGRSRGLKDFYEAEYTYLKYTLYYKSIFNGTEQTIKVELNASPKLYRSPETKQIQAIYIDPLLEQPLFRPQTISCFAIEEMIAEKCRAALTRHTPAIRDFYDLRYMSKHGYKLDADIDLIKAKCGEVVDDRFTIDEAYDKLKKQVETDLVPVLKDAEGFELDEIYNKLIDIRQSFYNTQKP